MGCVGGVVGDGGGVGENVAGTVLWHAQNIGCVLLHVSTSAPKGVLYHWYVVYSVRPTMPCWIGEDVVQSRQVCHDAPGTPFPGELSCTAMTPDHTFARCGMFRRSRSALAPGTSIPNCHSCDQFAASSWPSGEKIGLLPLNVAPIPGITGCAYDDSVEYPTKLHTYCESH